MNYPTLEQYDGAGDPMQFDDDAELFNTLMRHELEVANTIHSVPGFTRGEVRTSFAMAPRDERGEVEGGALLMGTDFRNRYDDGAKLDAAASIAELLGVPIALLHDKPAFGVLGATIVDAPHGEEWGA